MSGLLLDTCAAIWLAEGEKISESALDSINKTTQSGDVIYISAMTAWEVGLLTARGRIAISITPQVWFSRLLSLPGIAMTELSPAILIASSFLPGSPPRDPADRIIAATAREYGLRLVTRDRILLDYGNDGHLDVLAC
jgi:PIN domain nuclease of toxin-antitoxin system